MPNWKVILVVVSTLITMFLTSQCPDISLEAKDLRVNINRTPPPVATKPPATESQAPEGDS